MSDTVIQIENLSKQYRLGLVGRKSLSQDINRWWYWIRGKDDPYLKIGEENDRSRKGTSEYIWALRDINFEVKQGEILGLIGRNGAGKSTLLKILSKVTSPTTGIIKIKGRIASLLEVGTGFHPELTGRDNIFLNGAILGMTRNEIQNRFDEIVDFAGVEKYIDTPVKRYSSGMYLRLAFAVAAHLEPDILIVDEVLAVGDAEFQKKCLGKMKEVSVKDGRTVLFVSHNMPAILKLCSHTMLLQCGKNIFYGDTQDGINYYLNYKRNENGERIIARKDRKGNGLIQCTDIIFLNQQLLIQLLDANEEIVFICNNEHSTGLFAVINKGGSAICKIPKLPLFGGTYFINIQIFSREIGLLDDVEFAKELFVIDGDFFASGKIPAIRKGTLVSHSWGLSYGK